MIGLLVMRQHYGSWPMAIAALIWIRLELAWRSTKSMLIRWGR